MKSILRFLAPGLVLASLTFITGCKIEFTADTVVHADGSITRTLHYRPDDSTGVEEIKARYRLPEGGEWSETAGNGPSFYSSTQSFAPGKEIPPDYFRMGQTSGEAAQNQIRLTVQDFFLVKFYFYDESFRDILTRESASAAAAQWYAEAVFSLASAIASATSDQVTQVQASERLSQIYHPYFLLLLNGYLKDGVSFFNSSAFTDEIAPVIKDEALLAKLLELFPPPTPEEAAAWQESMARAIDSAGEAIARDNVKYQDRVLGAHTPVMTSYPFKMTLMLPGKVLESNASVTESGRLIWEFKPDDFRFKEYKMHAVSRLINPVRTTLVVGGLLAVIYLLLVTGRKRRGKRSKKS